jgi:WD40 repeat protein
VEVAHEALLREWPRLRGWLEEDVEGRRLHHHLGVAAREWDARGRDPGELYRGARLAAALDWSAGQEDELDAAERAFVDESRAASERSHRRLRAVLAGVGALLVLSVAAGLVALDQRGTARNRATAADAQRLGSRALAENDLDRSLLLARQGVALDDSAQTRGNLLAALIKSPAALGVMRGGGERMSAVALSPDERTLAAGDPAGNLFLFDTRTRRRVKAPEVHPGEWSISQLAYSPDGRRLGIAHDSADGHVLTLMDTRTRRMGPRLFLDEYGRRITGVRFAGATEVDVASAQLDPTTDPRSIVERFDLRTGRRSLGPRTLERQPSPLLATRDNRRVLTVTDERLVVRDGRTLGPVQSIDVGPSRGGRDARAIALGPDDRTAALGEQDGSVRFVDLRTGAVRRASGRHGGAVTGARFTPDGRSLVTTSDDGDAILWDVGAGAASETFRGHANGIAALQITRDGRTLYTAGLDGAIFAWDLAGTRRLGRPIEVGPPNRALAALSADGKRLALGHDNGAISVVDLEAPDRRRTFAVVPDGEEVIGVRFVPGSRLLVVAGPTLFTALVDTDTGRIIRALDRPGAEGLFTPGVSGDGRLLATPGATHGGDLIEVDLWSLPDGHRVGEPLRVDRQIHDLQLSPDGRLFIVVLANAGLEGGSVEAWDVRTRRRVRALRFARIQSFARFSPDGRRFAVGNRSGETRVYETATFKPVTRVLSGDAGAIISAAITPDRRTLATGSETGAVQLWDIPSGQALGAPLPGVPSSGVIPDFTPDGSTLVAAYASGRAYLWDIRPASLAQHACAVAGRRLTRAEWAEFLPGRDYEPAC